MFNILLEWLTSKLGINDCLNLNLNNVGERFKDGVLLARLLQKYQVIPDCYVKDFKKTNHYTVCLRNIKHINSWMKYLNILIDDDVIHEIANGQSLAITKLLYKLYLKFEMLKFHSCDINIIKIEPINNNMTIFCKSNDLSIKYNQDKKKHKERTFKPNKEIFNGLSLFCCLKGIEYTAIDVLKSKKNINASKNSILNFVQNNMNFFYDLFMKSLNSGLFINDNDEKYNEICRSSIFNFLNIKENTTTDNWSHNTLQEEIKHENSIHNSTEMESLTTQSLDDYSYKIFLKQDIFDDYIQHTGLWSPEYLNIGPYECKHDFLSKIITEVLNFDYDKSKVQFLEIKKSNIAGVIDLIQNKKVVQLIKNNLNIKEILSFTADDALTACLYDYKEEMKISKYKEKLYQVSEEHEHQVTPKQYSNNKEREKQDIKNSSTNSNPKIIKKISNNNTNSMHVTDKKFSTNKLTQTPEQIPEPDYNNPVLSSMAILGKLIEEKQINNHDLQIGDVINCIGEYIKKNQKKNGWLLLDFPVQPLQMTLLEYKLTSKIPTFGREICKNIKKKSKIISENQDDDNSFASKNTYLSHCIKIIKHQDEIKNEKWKDILQFYKQDCIQILINQFNNTIQPKKYANALIGLIINEENKLAINNIFKFMKMFDNDDNQFNDEDQGDDDITESENNGQQISELSLMNYEETNLINFKLLTNQFQLSSVESNLNNYTYTALHLCNMWESMEHNYEHQIKELLNLKHNFFEEIRIDLNAIVNAVNQIMFFHNPSVTNLINEYENVVKDNTINIKHTIFELQTNLWDKVDSEFEQITQSIKLIIDNQHTVAKMNKLIGIYKQLIEIELKRTITTLNFLNKYYENINEYNIDKFDYISITNENEDDIDMFLLFCTDIIHKIEKYFSDIYKVIDNNNKVLTQIVETEKNRFVNQVYTIKASMFIDKKYLRDLTKIDSNFEKMHDIYQFKINDINKLCEVSKCAVNIGKNIEGRIKQMSGKFYINETSIFDIIHSQMFDSRNTFSINQLKTIANKLLDNSPTFKMPINDLINTLNELGKKQFNIYPTNWPTNIQFYEHFTKKILGNNVVTIDWRDFIVQCMELPYPSIDKLLTYRKLFQTCDIGDETIAVENYITTKLWFENESHQYDEAKWLLCDMYQVKNRLNYSSMLLAFCRDKQPWIGLGKSFSLIFGWNPFGVKTQHINQSDNNHYEGSETHMEDINSNSTLCELSNEKFIFDKDIMQWFLTTILKLYMDSEKQLGTIKISQIVKSVFAHIQTKGIKPTFINLFQNNVMDELYNTVYKFQIKELSEIAQKIEMTKKV